MASEIRAGLPQIDDTEVFGSGVVTGCGNGPGVWFGDIAEIPLMGRNPAKRFDSRLGWLADDGNIVVIGGPGCRSFETYQRERRQAPSITYLNVDPNSKPPRVATLAVCLGDPDAHARLVGALDGATGVTIHAHQTTGRAWALAPRPSKYPGSCRNSRVPPCRQTFNRVCSSQLPT